MPKILIIEKCRYCPNFNWQLERCIKYHIDIALDDPIPEKCGLSDAPEGMK